MLSRTDSPSTDLAENLVDIAAHGAEFEPTSALHWRYGCDPRAQSRKLLFTYGLMVDLAGVHGIDDGQDAVLNRKLDVAFTLPFNITSNACSPA